LASVRAAVPDWELWLVVGEDGPLAEEARKLGVQVIQEQFPPALARLGDGRTRRLTLVAELFRAAAASASYKGRLARIVQSLEPDVIHTNGLKMHLLGAWTRPNQTPLVWHIHDYISTRRLTSRLLRLSRKGCSVAVANSQSVVTDLRSLLPNLPVVPIYNAIDLERFSTSGRKLDLDALSGLPPAAPGTVRVGLIATFARWKGHRVFLRALAQLAPEVPIRGYIIGGPIYQTSGSQWSREELEEQARSLGLEGKVGFTGFVRDTPAALRTLDIAVHASTAPEPFGMVIIEAMACGKAVIAAQAGGASELFTDGENALGHSPGDEAGLAQQIMRLAADSELRERLGQAGRQAAEKRFHGKRLVQELLAVYRDLGARSGELVMGSERTAVEEVAAGSAQCGPVVLTKK